MPQTRADVFLVGAGLSRALGAEMPLVRQLIAAVATDLEDRGLKASLAMVPFATSDFEKALTYLAESQPWLSEPDRLRNKALFLDIADSIHRVLVRAESQLLRQTPECAEWLQRLVWWVHSNQAVIITLN